MEKRSLIEPNGTVSFTVTPDSDQKRLDVFLSEQLADYSRSFLQGLIKGERVTINTKVAKKPSRVLEIDDEVVLNFPPAPDKKEVKQVGDDLGAYIIAEEPDYFIVYKPPGISMHAAHTHDSAITLADWLLSQFESLASVGDNERPGIVHRLDKYTSGLVIIPRNNVAHAKIGDLFKERAMQKTYLALVAGHPRKEGVIDLSVAPHPSHTRMTVLKRGSTHGRSAETYYKVLEYFDDAALIEVKPRTGRTHQIRVHMASLGHPLLGDVVYGTPSKLIDRQALHAKTLEFAYEGAPKEFSSDLPADFQQAIDQLRISKKD